MWNRWWKMPSRYSRHCRPGRLCSYKRQLFQKWGRLPLLVQCHRTGIIQRSTRIPWTNITGERRNGRKYSFYFSCQQGWSRADEWKVPYIETSAKTKQNIDKAFHDLMKIIQSHKKAEMKPGGKPAKKEKKKKKKKCVIL